MRMTIYRQLVYIINDQRTWAKAIDANLYKRHMKFYNRHWLPYVGRTLVLQSIKDYNQYRKGTQWFIPEHELDRALAILRKQDPHIKRRFCIGAHKMLPHDAERIIEIATYGKVKLNLRAFNSQNPFF